MDRSHRHTRLPGLLATLLVAATSVMLAPAALAQEIMFCGSSSRVGSNLYGAAGPFTEVNGCTPNPTTQTLLVSRSGAIGGNGGNWLAFLNGGGVIITEYSISHTVYNEIYGTAHPQGAGYGGCRDNAMPQVKLNSSHPFWQANDINVTPAGQESCGYRLNNLVSAEAEVIELGETLAGDVMFAIRPQGEGVLFLLDADWQDNEGFFTDDSRLFMAALIEGGSYSPPSDEAKPIPVMPLWGIALLSGLLLLLGVGRTRRFS